MVTEPTSHTEMSWLNAAALKNIKAMLLTEPTLHNEMSLLKLDAPTNINDMLVTNLTFHFPMFWLNEDAWRNIPCILVTNLTSHSEMSSSNVVLPKKRKDISVMRVVHQVPIGQPQVFFRLIHACEEILSVQSLLI